MEIFLKPVKPFFIVLLLITACFFISYCHRILYCVSICVFNFTFCTCISKFEIEIMISF